MPAEIIHFAEFELDLGRYQLRRGDRVVKLEKSPMELLILLVERQGQLVTREEIIHRLWGENVFVDTRHGINTAIHKLRTALHDDSELPRILETVVGKGYRLVAVVASSAVEERPPETTGHRSVAKKTFPHEQNAVVVKVLEAQKSTTSSGGVPAPTPSWRRRVWRWLPGALTLIVVAATTLGLVPRTVRDRLFGSRPNGASIKSLAVLPFENLSGDSSKDYFADGFTDELITDVAEQAKIRVVSRSSVLRYKGSRKPLPEIAKELRVDAIVEGSVSFSDQQVRITAQLIQASSDRHLWAHSYEKNRRDLFSIQSEVAATIAGLIGANAGIRNLAAASLDRRFTPETYQLYLECNSLMNTGTEDGFSHAIQCYQQILNLDPNCASAYAGIAYSYYELPKAGNQAKARIAAMKAVELDPSLPDAHLALARIKLAYDKDLVAAESEINRALSLNPSDARGYVTHAVLLAASGRGADAVTAAKTARSLDPFSAPVVTYSGMYLFMNGQYDEAVVEEQAALQLDPRLFWARYWLGYTYEQKGMYQNAIAEYERALPKDEQGMFLEHGIFLAALGRSYALAGNAKKAAEIREKMEHLPAGDLLWPYDAALFYAVLGDKDRAFQWLERDQKEGGGWFLFLNVDPRLSTLRSDPRFRDLVRRAGLPSASPN